MRAVIETVFDIFYLVTVLTVGIRMIRGSKAGTCLLYTSRCV